MSLPRATAAAAARLLRARGGGGAGRPFFSAGTRDSTGRLFNETPPPPGQKRKWESWEAIWYGTLVGGAALLIVGLNARPDSTITTWARKEAEKEL